MKIRASFYTPFEHEVEAERFEPVVCDLCGEAERSPIGQEGPYAIYCCAGCGLVYVSPQPAASELPKLYESMYADTSEQAIRGRSLGHVERHIRRIVQRRCPGGSYLDIGCGFGALLRELTGLPFEFTGIEMSRAAVEIARSAVPQATIIESAIGGAPLEPASQDFILMIAMLEHVKQPRATLERVTEWLTPGGTLLVQVPYTQHFIRLKSLLPWLPIHFEAPPHLFDFSPATLTRYFRELGYEDIRVEIARPYAAPTRIRAALIWAVKVPGLALYHLSGRRYVYPYAAAIVVHARKPQV